jgi:hypothetical protein
MPFRREINSYAALYAANTFNPRIGIMTANNLPLGQLVFLPDGAQLPADFQTPNGQVQLHYHRQDFSNILNILRNEKPIFLFFTGPGFENSIGTDVEPVGEDE